MNHRGLTLTEVFVILVIVAILASMVPMAVSPARESARRAQCHNNLRSLVSAMTMYSDSPSNNGYFPTHIPSGGSINDMKGTVSLSLLYRQYVNDPRIFVCPSDPQKPTAKSLSEISSWPTDGSLPVNPMKPEDSSYAYNPGHHINDRVLFMSDKKGALSNSDNHGPNAGQNVSFGAGVEFITSPGYTVEGGKPDPDIFARNTELKFEEDSFLRQ